MIFTFGFKARDLEVFDLSLQLADAILPIASIDPAALFEAG